MTVAAKPAVSRSRSCAPASRAAKGPTIDAEALAALLKALAHPARIQLLRHLSDHSACYFGSLSDVVHLAPSTTSQHMKILQDAGLVLASPEGQRTCYCVNRDRLAVLKQLVEGL